MEIKWEATDVCVLFLGRIVRKISNSEFLQRRYRWNRRTVRRRTSLPATNLYRTRRKLRARASGWNGEGNGLVDNVQLAYIVGDADPDENGIMSSKISSLVEGKTGEATYGLQCAFTDEKTCKPNAQGKNDGIRPTRDAVRSGLESRLHIRAEPEFAGMWKSARRLMLR